MIVSIAGVLLEKRPTDAVVEAGGLGYALAIPASSFDKLPPVGQPVKLLARQVIREDAHLLFGFASEAERALFDAMISVQGVGPKLALAALSAMNPAELRETVLAGDAGPLTRIPGVGRKTAERMVVELRDRLAKLDGIEGAGVLGGTGLGAEARADARAGLESLGLARAEAEKRLRKILREHPGLQSAEELIRLALRVT